MSDNKNNENTGKPETRGDTFTEFLKGFFGVGQEFHLQLANQELKIPLNLWSALVLIFGVYFVTSTYSQSTSQGNYSGSLVSFITDVKDGETSLRKKDEIIFQFWTPSEKTIASMNAATYQDVVKNNQTAWYTLSENPDLPEEEVNSTQKINKEFNPEYRENPVLADFGKALKTRLGSTGYSYWESRGTGSNGYKMGYIWEATFKHDVDVNQKAEEFALLYKEVFKRDKRIYLKTLGADVARIQE